MEVDPVHGLVLRSSERAVLEEAVRAKAVAPLLGPRIDTATVAVPGSDRGRLKQALLKVGWPAEDRAGYVDGTSYPIVPKGPEDFSLRPYQREAVDAFAAAGSGVVVLPCGAGKTLVGIGAMAGAGAHALVLVTNTVAARQWRSELLSRTHLTETEIGEYSGERKEVRPVTIAILYSVFRSINHAMNRARLSAAQFRPKNCPHLQNLLQPTRPVWARADHIEVCQIFPVTRPVG